MDSEKQESAVPGGDQRSNCHSTTMFEGRNIHQSPVDGKLLCSYSGKVCMQRRLNRYAFCIRHILEDKCAPFKQCQFFAKYNSSRCINPVPVSENRTYCNSHLQVLGLLPKKVRKKKGADASRGANQNTDSKSAALQSNKKRKKASGEESSSTMERNTGEKGGKKTARKKTGNEIIASKKAKVVSSINLQPSSVASITTAEKLHKNVEEFKAKRNAFKKEGPHLQSYMFDYGSESEHEMASSCPLSTTDDMTARNSSAETDMRYQLWQIKTWIRANRRDRKLSYSMLRSMVKAARSSPKQLSCVITGTSQDNHAKTELVIKRPCGFSLQGHVPCKKFALPFARFCMSHIESDEHQVLFSCCRATLPDGTSCPQMVFQNENEQRMCSIHASTSQPQIGSVDACRSSLTSSLDNKTDKVTVTNERSHLKQAKSMSSLSGKRSLKAQIQKKFSIVPTFGSTKMNQHVKERRGSLQITLPTAERQQGPLPDRNSLSLSPSGMSSLNLDCLESQDTARRQHMLLNGNCKPLRGLVAGDNEMTLNPSPTKVMHPLSVNSGLEATKISARAFTFGQQQQQCGGIVSASASCFKESQPLQVHPNTLLTKDMQQQQHSAAPTALLRQQLPFHTFAARSQPASDLYSNKRAFQAASSSRTLKSFVRLTMGPVPSHSTSLTNAPMISPPFHIAAAPTHSQIFRFDPAAGNSFITASPSQHHSEAVSANQRRSVNNISCGELKGTSQIRPKMNPDIFLSSSSMLSPAHSSNSHTK